MRISDWSSDVCSSDLTETTVAPNGDFYIADGYGQQHVMQYDYNGKLKAHFGGRGDGDAHLDNAHGICVDYRGEGDPTLLVTDRTRCCFKRFSMEGKLLDVIKLPGACVCRTRSEEHTSELQSLRRISTACFCLK